MGPTKPAHESSFRITAGLTLLLISLSCQVTAAGAGQNDNATILIHLAPVVAKNPCLQDDADPPCSSVVTRGRLYPQTYTAYLLLADVGPAAGITGLECGIDHNNLPSAGVDVFSWSPCGNIASQYQLDGWPEARGGLILIWGDCQSGVPGDPGMGNVVTCGSFYCAAYSPDQLQATPHYGLPNICNLPDLYYAGVADCNNEITDLESHLIDPATCEYVDVHRTPYPLGFASFSANGDVAGYNPCGAVVSVESTTWSGIKTSLGKK